MVSDISRGKHIPWKNLAGTVHVLRRTVLAVSGTNEILRAKSRGLVNQHKLICPF